MLKGKWKFLLFLNYISVGLWALIFLTALFKFYEASNKNYHIPGNIFFVIGLGIIIVIFNVVGIYILKTQFPARALRGLFNALHLITLVLLGIVTFFFFAALIISGKALLDSKTRDDIKNIFPFIIILSITTVNIILIILHIQLPNYIKQNHKSEVNDLITNFGVIENESNQ